MFLFFDVETTGFLDFKAPSDQQVARVVELCALLCDPVTLDVQDSVCAIIKPDGWTVPADVAKIHGITTEKAMDEGRPIADVLEEMDALEDATETRIAWNKRFDLKFLRGERRRAGMDDRYGQAREFDPMWAAKPLVGAVNKKGHAKLPNLEEAFMFFMKRPLLEAHRAGPDTEATRLIVREMRDRWKVDINGEMPKMYEEGETQAPLPPGARTASDSPTKKPTPNPLEKEPVDFDNLKVF